MRYMKKNSPYYRIRTEDQVKRKIDSLKTNFVVRKLMGKEEIDSLHWTSWFYNFKATWKRRRKAIQQLDLSQKMEVMKIKRLERKLRRMKEGKWRERHE